MELWNIFVNGTFKFKFALRNGKRIFQSGNKYVDIIDFTNFKEDSYKGSHSSGSQASEYYEK